MTAEKKKKIPLYARFSKPLVRNLYVEQANFWKRLAAFVIDFVLAAIIATLAYFAVIHPLWFNHLGGYENNEKLLEEQLASGLYTEFGSDVIRIADFDTLKIVNITETTETNPLSFWTRLDDENGTIVPSDVYYDAALRSFYNDYGGFNFTKSTYYDIDTKKTKNYDRDILLYTGEASDFIISKTEHEVGEATLFTFTYQTGVSKVDINNFWRTQYFTAVDENLRHMPTYFALQSYITNAVRLMVAFSYVIGSLVFHMLIPLLSKDGQSTGKMLMKIAVVNKDGYRAEPWQIVVRVVVTDILEIIGSLYLYLIPLLLTLAALTMSRQQRSIHDFVAKTRVINFSNSYIFKNEAEAKDYMAAVKSGTLTDISPGGGLGIAATKQ